MVAQVVPPPFAEQLSISVFGYQVSALERMRAQARLALLAGMAEDEAVGSKFKLSSTWFSDVDDSVFLSDDFGATGLLRRTVKLLVRRSASTVGGNRLVSMGGVRLQSPKLTTLT